MDPLSIASSAAGIVGLCATLIKTLSKFVEDVGNVDSIVTNLYREVGILHTVLNNIERTCDALNNIEKTYKIRLTYSESERQHWRDLGTVLGHCHRTLDRLNIILFDLDPEKDNDRAGRKPTKQIRLRQKYPVISALKANIHSYILTLQLSLQTISLVAQCKSQASQNDIDTRLKRLAQGVKTVKDFLLSSQPLIEEGHWDFASSVSGEDISEDETMVMDDVRKCLSSVETVMDRATVDEPDDRSSSRRGRGDKLDNESEDSIDDFDGIESVISFDSESGSSVDPEPDARDVPPADFLTDLIEGLQIDVKNDLDAGHYENAKKTQLKIIGHLDDRERYHRIPFKDRSQTQELLAEIYRKQKKYEKAKRILMFLLKEERGKTDTKWRLYHSLAKIYYEEGKLKKAAKFANRASIGRIGSLEKGHVRIIESVTLLVKILEQRGEIREAETYKKRYLPSSKAAEGASIPEVESDGIRENRKALSWLKEKGFDVNEKGFKVQDAMRFAIEDGNDTATRALLNREKGGSGKRALVAECFHWAVAADQLTIVKLLLGMDAGASVDTLNKDGKTALISAILSGQNEMVWLLLKMGAGLEVRDKGGRTPLMYGAESHNVFAVKTLLEEGAKVNAKDEFGWTALHRAQVRPGGDEVAKYILAYRADIDAVCENKKTALHYAVEKSNESMAALLIDKNADIEAVDIGKRTPLHTAIEHRKKVMVRLLLDRGADVKAKDDFGYDALRAASHAENRSPEIVSMLKGVKSKRGSVDSGLVGRSPSAISSASTLTTSGSSFWSRRSSRDKNKS